MTYIRLIIATAILAIGVTSVQADSARQSFFKKDRSSFRQSVFDSNKSEIRDYKTKARARIKANKELGKRRMAERRQRENSLMTRDLHADITQKGREVITQSQSA